MPITLPKSECLRGKGRLKDFLLLLLFPHYLEGKEKYFSLILLFLIEQIELERFCLSFRRKIFQHFNFYMVPACFMIWSLSSEKGA